MLKYGLPPPSKASTPPVVFFEWSLSTHNWTRVMCLILFYIKWPLILPTLSGCALISVVNHMANIFFNTNSQCKLLSMYSKGCFMYIVSIVIQVSIAQHAQWRNRLGLDWYYYKTCWQKVASMLNRLRQVKKQHSIDYSTYMVYVVWKAD